MITSYDDFPIHQTTEPVNRPVSSDLNYYDRYWFSGFDETGEFMFEIAHGIYPNRQVADAALSIVRKDGKQHSVLASRRVPADRSDTRVGPIQVSVPEPLRTLRVTVDANETGIEADLTFRARNSAVEEPPMRQHRDGRLIMDTSRLTQFGKWEGYIVADGVRTEVNLESTFGVRDRSWGVRPVGEALPGMPPSLPEVFWLWSPIHFDDSCVHYGVFEDRDGDCWYSNGAVLPAFGVKDDFSLNDEAGLERIMKLTHEIKWRKGTRRAEALTLGLIAPDESVRSIELEPLLPFQMQGIGYGHPTFAHATWQGEEKVIAEHWNVFETNPMEPRGLHVQQVVRAKMGDKIGVGLCEQVVFGPHAPSGFKEFLDPAS